jgi:hypothetical protein
MEQERATFSRSVEAGLKINQCQQIDTPARGAGKPSSNYGKMPICLVRALRKAAEVVK